MIELAYIARPLIGAVIGYITNDIAIRMLFRPRTAKMISKIHGRIEEFITIQKKNDENVEVFYNLEFLYTFNHMHNLDTNREYISVL